MLMVRTRARRLRGLVNFETTTPNTIYSLNANTTKPHTNILVKSLILFTNIVILSV